MSLLSAEHPIHLVCVLYVLVHTKVGGQHFPVVALLAEVAEKCGAELGVAALW